jgi:hypothetical protein
MDRPIYRRPIDQERQRLIRSLKNRRDTLVQNIVRFQGMQDLQGVAVNRDEANRINRQLQALQS